MCNTCKGCIFNRGIVPNTDRIYCEYIDDDTINNRCEYFEEVKIKNAKLIYIGNDVIDVFRCSECNAFIIDEDCKECPNCHAIFEENNNND